MEEKNKAELAWKQNHRVFHEHGLLLEGVYTTNEGWMTRRRALLRWLDAVRLFCRTESDLDGKRMLEGV
jgi:hypothetical protein